MTRKNLILEDTRNERIIKGYIKRALPQYAQYWGVPIGNTPIYRQEMGVNPSTPTMTFFKNYFLSAFDIHHGKGPEKFIPGIARIAFDELGFLKSADVADNDILRLKNLVLFLSNSEMGNQFNENLNGVDFEGLNDTVGQAMKQSNAANRERLSQMSSQNRDYRVVPIHSFEEASKYGQYTSWCVTHGQGNYDQYTAGGRRFYFLLKQGFESIEVPRDAISAGAPLDEYGLSMISVLVDMEGEPADVTTRWNHEHNGENNPDFKTAEDVQKVTGINFYKELVPYSREELRAMGITPFEDVPELLAQGVPFNKIFERVEDVECPDCDLVRLNGKCNLVNYREQRLQLKRWVDEISYFIEGLARVKINGKYGFIDESGREVTPCKYDSAGNFSEGLAMVKINGKWGYIDKSGREVIPCKYDDAFDFSMGLAEVETNGKCGFVDKSGREVIPCKYDWVFDFSEGLAMVVINVKWGFVDKSGREVIPCKYDGAGNFSEGLAVVEINGKCGFVDKSGREVIPCKYDDAFDFSEGLARVKINGRWGYIDKSGREVIPCKYDDAFDFSMGLAEVETNGKWGFVDESGREVIPCKYDEIGRFSEGLAMVRINGKWGFVDESGREVIPCKYDGAGNFSEGHARVKINGKYGFVDKSGREVIPCKYDGAGNFSGGLARVKINGRWGFIDKEGNWYDEKPTNLQENAYLLSIGDIHKLVNESLKKYKKKKKSSNRVPSAQEQVGGKVNAGLLDGAYGLMEEEPDFYIGMEGNSNAEYAHVSQGSAGAPLNESVELTNDDYKEKFKSIGNYMDKNGLKVKPFPRIRLDNSDQDGLFIKTGYYAPEEKLVVLFTKDRHPKDILRSFTHEMVHHAQNLRGDDLSFSENDDVKNNERLEEIESEAYLKGNIYFRKWTEYFKNGEEKELLNESIKKSDIDFQSFKIQNNLNPKFWQDDKLNSKVRLSLLKIADDFIKWVGVKFNHSDIIITGSLANYTWNKRYSDIDLHILVDFSKFKGGKTFAKEFFSAKKSLWNEKHEKMKILGYPVEIYVQDTAEFHKSSGIYSLEKDSWIEEPDKDKLTKGKIDKKKVKDTVVNYADRIDDVEEAFKKAKSEYDLRTLEKDAEKILSDIRNERKSGFANNESEINDGNVIFKTLRRTGYIGKIIDLIDDIYDKMAGFEI